MKKLAILALLILIYLSNTSFTQSLDYSSSALFSGCSEIKIRDNFAYCAFYDGLVIIDITDYSHPSLLSELYLPGLQRDVHGPYIELMNNYAYLLMDYLYIIDVTNPSSPFEVGRYDSFHAHGFHLAVSGNYVYTQDLSSRFLIIDVSNPANPTLSGSCAVTGWPYDLAVSGNYAFSMLDGFMATIDISNPFSPLVLGYYDTPGGAHGITIRENIAFIADYNAGLTILDISNPSLPILLGNTPFEYSENVSVNGQYAYLAAGIEPYRNGIQIVNIANLSNPLLCGHYQMPGSFYNQQYVACDQNMVFAPHERLGIYILNPSDPNNPVLSGRYETDYVYDCQIQGQYLFVANGNLGLKIFDISNSENPILVSNLSTDGSIARLKIEGNYLYFKDDIAGLKIVDISNINQPEPIGTILDSTGIACFDISGFYAYLQKQDTMVIVDISNPTNPQRVGAYPDHFDIPTASIHVNNNYAYLVQSASRYGYRIIIVNVEDHHNPIFSGIYTSHISPYCPLNMFVKDNYAYIATERALPMGNTRGALEIVDISNPSSFNFLGFFEFGEFGIEGFSNIFVENNVAYVSDLLAVNVENPASPFTVTEYPIGVRNMCGFNNYIYIAADNALMTLHFNSTDIRESFIPTAFSLSQSYPNPFNAQTTISYTLPISSDVSLDIFDILGRKIETLQSGHHGGRRAFHNLECG